jgi:diaminopimelate decarboxylase
VTAADRALDAALASGLVDVADTAVIMIDLDIVRRQYERAVAAFPPTAHHAVAIKSNPLVCVLSELAAWGAHAEAASAEELLLARVAGFADRTVWDSPAKTRREIHDALEDPPGLTNVDSFAELERYPPGRTVRLGLRINPERRPDTIASLATGVSGSKFGVGISERERIIEAFALEPRLRCLHVHSGSNSRSLDPMVEGVAAVVALADEINRGAGKPQIDTIDIGGGLPWSESADEPLSVERYATALRSTVPRLFDGTYRIVTEFGRYHHLGAGTTATRVEYVKQSGSSDIAVVHVGADSFVREVYDRDNWALSLRRHGGGASNVHDATSDSNGSSAQRVDVVGPLCFEGDFLERDTAGLDPVEGGWLMIDQTGANTFSLWSRHCSRALPKVLLYEGADPARTVRIGKDRQSALDAISAWS